MIIGAAIIGCIITGAVAIGMRLAMGADRRRPVPTLCTALLSIAVFIAYNLAMPSQVNIRVDLLLTAPLAVVNLIITLELLLKWRR